MTHQNPPEMSNGSSFRSLLMTIVAFLMMATAPSTHAQFLSFVADYVDNNQGGKEKSLDGTRELITSADGKHVYVSAFTDDALSAYERDEVTGELTSIGEYVDDNQPGGGEPGLNGAAGLAFDPTERYLYVTGESEDAISVYQRDTLSTSPNFGQLTHVQTIFDVAPDSSLNGPRGIAVSPDGKHVYVGARFDDAISVYARDMSAGTLTIVQVLEDDSQIGGTETSINGPWAVQVSPDGKHVYIASNSDDAIAVYSRDAVTGVLTHVEDKIDTEKGGTEPTLDGAREFSFSQSGDFLYVTAEFDHAISVYSRNGTTGALTFVQNRVDDFAGGSETALQRTIGVAVTPDGSGVYVTGRDDDALNVYARNPIDGTLTFLQALIDDFSGGPEPSLGGVSFVDVSPNSLHIYTAAEFDDAVSVYQSGGPLPVELTTFDALAVGSTVRLSWTTASETNNEGFEIEHRPHVEESWQTLGFVAGLVSSSEPTSYSFSVDALDPGVHRFRLRQIDRDGFFNYSAEVEATVEVPGKYALGEVYPNPFNPSASFTLGVSKTQHVSVVLYDIIGRPVATLHDGTIEADQSVELRIDGSALSSGFYVVNVKGETFSDTRQAVLMK